MHHRLRLRPLFGFQHSRGDSNVKACPLALYICFLYPWIIALLYFSQKPLNYLRDFQQARSQSQSSDSYILIGKMRKLIYPQDQILKQEFKGILGSKAKNSGVSINNQGTILCKSTDRRTYAKSVREVAALAIWHRLLSKYNQSSEYQIVSPKPIGITGNPRFNASSVYMSYEKGEDSRKILNMNFPGAEKLKKWRKKAARANFCKHLGRLLRIKNIERLVHHDLNLRHLLFDPEQNKLIVIDVENSYYIAPKNRLSPLQEDHAKVLGRVLKLFKREQAGVNTKTGKALMNAIHEGYESVPATEPKLGKIIEEVNKESQKNLEHSIDFKYRWATSNYQS